MALSHSAAKFCWQHFILCACVCECIKWQLSEIRRQEYCKETVNINLIAPIPLSSAQMSSDILSFMFMVWATLHTFYR